MASMHGTRVQSPGCAYRCGQIYSESHSPHLSRQGSPPPPHPPPRVPTPTGVLGKSHSRPSSSHHSGGSGNSSSSGGGSRHFTNWILSPATKRTISVKLASGSAVTVQVRVTGILSGVVTFPNVNRGVTVYECTERL